MRAWLAVMLILLPVVVFGYVIASYTPRDSPLPVAVAHPPTMFTRSVETARSYWAKRHVSTPCGEVKLILVRRIPNPFVQGATGGAQKGVCNIMFTRQWFTTVEDNSVIVCASVIHELGHVDGLDHSPDPRNIMYIKQTGQSIPNICRGS